MKVMFLYLRAFSGHGGIEKFNKALMMALSTTEGIKFFGKSLYDNRIDVRYVKDNNYISFLNNKVLFALSGILDSKKMDMIILGHINLYPIGFIIKKLFPKKRLILIAHGIEVWNQKGLKNKYLKAVDEIFAVSNYTKQQLINNNVDPKKIKILNNTLDPFFKIPKYNDKPRYLKNRYGLKENEKILITVSRLSAEEKYKGYDKVIEVLPRIKNTTSLKYLIIGKYDEEEILRLKKLIKDKDLDKNVIFAGFVSEQELTDHYLLGDIFIMPSKGEGFGIVFLEAMVCGLKVIAGNKEGSSEPLLSGSIGTLVDPDNEDELVQSINSGFNVISTQKTKEMVMANFSFENFRKNLSSVLN